MGDGGTEKGVREEGRKRGRKTKALDHSRALKQD
jgi:hypothetical protein